MGAVGVSQHPWTPSLALLRPRALVAALIPPQLLPPSSSPPSFPPPPPFYSLLLPEEPRPLLPPSSTTSTFQDGRVQSTTGDVVRQTLALPWEKWEAGASRDYK